MANFDLTRYLGTWYEIAVDAQTPFEIFSECITGTYTLIDESTIKIDNKAWRWLFPQGWTQLIGKATLVDSRDASLNGAFYGREVSSKGEAS